MKACQQPSKDPQKDKLPTHHFKEQNEKWKLTGMRFQLHLTLIKWMTGKRKISSPLLDCSFSPFIMLDGTRSLKWTDCQKKLPTQWQISYVKFIFLLHDSQVIWLTDNIYITKTLKVRRQHGAPFDTRRVIGGIYLVYILSVKCQPNQAHHTQLHLRFEEAEEQFPK